MVGPETDGCGEGRKNIKKGRHREMTREREKEKMQERHTFKNRYKE